MVRPAATDVRLPVEGASTLTLTICHHKGSATQRLATRFSLVTSEPQA